MGRGQRKRFKAEVKVRYHHDNDVQTKRAEQLDVGECSINVDEPVHDHALAASDFEYSDEGDEPETSTTLHYRRLQRAEDAWSKLREGALATTFEKQSSLFGKECYFCHSEDGVCRCLDCSSTISFCESCAISNHSQHNIFHRVEILRDGNIYFPLAIQRTLLLHGHQCMSTTSSNVHLREVIVVDSRGYQTEVKVQFCNCEPDFLRLLRFNLWGATPTKPELAFTLDLMKLLHTLNLECQVAVKDFSAALQTLTDDVIIFSKQRKLYPVIIDSLEEFRIYRHKLSTLKFTTSASDLSDTIECPACPKNQGTLLESMDALFIGRKKSAGKSVRNPLFGTVLFDDDAKVEEFVQQHPTTSRATTACADFLAGDALRSRSRYSALSETAIFGRACRHEFPKKFINMKHGERLAYPVWILNHLLDEISDQSPGIDVCVLYDIACLLETHLQAQGQHHILQSVKFAIPIFHSYGHKAKCQITYSPRRVPGFGLTDGEVLERLWSFLRRFGKMTKEMRPNHRVDVLSDALLFYARKKSASLGKLLSDRMKRANSTIKDSEEELTKLLDSLPAPVRREDVAEWANQEAEWTGGLENPVEQPSWKHGYVIYLKMFCEIRSKWEEASDPEKLQQLNIQLNKLERVLVDLERKNGITQRWTTTCEEYQLARDAANDRSKKLALVKLHAKVIERWFLLSLKAKYAEGHALAKRLSKQISQAAKSMKTAVAEFNKLECSTRWPLPSSLEFDEVKNPEADLWLRSEFVNSSTSPVPITIRRKAVDLYNLVDRAKEEVTLLQSEMKNVIDHFNSQHAIFTSALSDTTSYSISLETKGRDVYIKMKLLSIESHLLELKTLFESHIHEITLPSFVFDREDLPLNNDAETEMDNEAAFLSLPERDDALACDSDSDSDSEYENEIGVTDDADSAFFSLTGM